MDQTKKRQLRVFLCYAKSDITAVRSLYDSLLANNMDAWLDEEKLLPGQKPQEEIPKAVKNSDVVIVFLSKSSINKEGYIQKVIKFALDIADEKPEGMIYIIPARLDDCSVPERFSQYQWVDLFETSGHENLLQALTLQRELLGLEAPSSINETMNSFPIEYREEVLYPFFRHIASGESFYIVGAPSAGKTRLIDFIFGDVPDNLRAMEKDDRELVKKKYLDKVIAAKTWLIRVDMNRMELNFDWKFLFYELLLHTILLACYRYRQLEQIETIEKQIFAFHAEVIAGKDALTAHRNFETAVGLLCQLYNIRICFIFDEFDEMYQTIPREVFAQLRAASDANKYRIFYALFLRNLPEKLRNPTDNEGFYELISRNMIGMGPYSQQDTYHIIEQLEKRRDYVLPQNKREWLCINSGGHPGLIQALYTIFKDRPSITISPENMNWFVGQESVKEEFRKLWTGLMEEEQNGLLEFARGNQVPMSQATGKLLAAKGLLKPTANGIDFFSPLFKPWLLR